MSIISHQLQTQQVDMTTDKSKYAQLRLLIDREIVQFKEKRGLYCYYYCLIDGVKVQASFLALTVDINNSISIRIEDNHDAFVLLTHSDADRVSAYILKERNQLIENVRINGYATPAVIAHNKRIVTLSECIHTNSRKIAN